MFTSGHLILRCGRIVGSRVQTLAARPGIIETRRTLPVCSVQTNLQGQQIPGDFEQGLSKVLAATLNKPEKLISVSVLPGTRMLRGGNSKPTVTLEIWSVGVFDGQRNSKYTQDIMDYVISKLQLPHDRIVLLLHPLQPEDAGHLIYAKLRESTS